MATPTYPPHPLLKEPVLYVADPPNHVRWAHLRQMFDCCGKVTYNGLCFVHDPRLGIERQYYPVHFANLFEAEMALATLQGETVDGVDPPWALALSHSPTLESVLPTGRRWPQRVIPNVLPGDTWPGMTTAQTIFRWFRSVGPLVSVRMNMAMGNSQNATVIEYWNKAHSDIAGAAPNLVHSAMLDSVPRVPRLTLRFFDLCSVRCSGALFSFGQTGKEGSYATSRRELMEKLASFGEITRVHFSKLGEGLNDIVSFQSPQSAAQVLSAMSKEISCIKLYHRFEYYDGPELPFDSSKWHAPDPVPSRSPSSPTESPAMDDTTRSQSSTPKSPNSHPLLSRPTLYIVNPPNHVVWDRLQAEFASRGCSPVRNLGKTAVEGRLGSFKWAVGFKNLSQGQARGVHDASNN
ncbi:hypothetical protein BC629DRAFT_1508739 [Irpex lacteus]|nr:hypothetical protein BC629DRAFT_1508739 [Irpex lacteus]